MKTNQNIIDNFYELYSEASIRTEDSFYDELGVSKDEYLTDKLKMIKRLKLKSIVEVNKPKNQERLNFALKRIQEVWASSNNQLTEKIEKIIFQRSPQFQFRNINKLDINDLSEILDDLSIIEIIEELEKTDHTNE
ncbi:MAG: hypothetical protein C0596_06155 [Marinilabiliales bacterium]|nr:MAG: hypothetical protein C0596_06155 [Marinilabiliales bacterium]